LHENRGRACAPEADSKRGEVRAVTALRDSRRSSSEPDPEREPMFQALDVETLNRCNRTCGFCKFGLDRYRNAREPKQEMSWELIRKIVGELEEIEFAGRLSWFMINEPLLDRRIFEIYEYSVGRLPRTHHTVISNGDLMTEASCERFLALGVRVGISCYDDETLARVSAFREAGRIRLIDSRKPRDFVESRGGNIEDPELVGELSYEEIGAMGCLRPSSSLYIRTNGEAVLCCGDLFGEVVLGDVRTTSLRDVWQNEKYRAIRSHLATQGRRGLRLCENCSYDGSPAPVLYP
jgi:MoaA/NifB/PqqE/SkfB family radical SAM enzyme